MHSNSTILDSPLYQDLGTQFTTVFVPAEEIRDINTDANSQLEKYLVDLKYDGEIKILIKELYGKLEEKSANKIYPSITAENEIALYSKIGSDSWKNLIIDEDGDVELLMIPKNRKKSFNERFFVKDGNYSIDNIVSRFNEL